MTDDEILSRCPTDDAARTLFRQTPGLQAEFNIAGEGGFVAYAAAMRRQVARRYGRTVVNTAPPASAGGITPATVPATDEAAKAAYAASPAIRAEFGTVETYTAWARATRSGRARIHAPGINMRKP